ASAAGAKETTSTRGSASRRCVTERAQEATQASAPKAPGRLGREDARSFGAGTQYYGTIPRAAPVRRGSFKSDPREVGKEDFSWPSEAASGTSSRASSSRGLSSKSCSTEPTRSSASP